MSAWAKWVNQNGGVNGHPVKMIVMDDGGNSTTELQDVRTLVESDHIQALVGETDEDTGAIAKYIASKNIPVIGGNSVDPTFLSSPDYYPIGATAIINLVADELLARSHHLDSMGLLYCAEDPVCASLGALAKGVSALIPPVKLAYAGKVAATAPNYDATCAALQSAKVNALAIETATATVIRVSQQCTQFGFKSTLVDSDPPVSKEMITTSSLNGGLFVADNANWTDTSIPAIKTFQDALNSYKSGTTSQESFNANDLEAWAGGMLFLAAAKAAKLTPSSTGADVAKGLYKLKNETLGGLTVPLTFTPGKPTVVSCYFTRQITGGKLVTSNGGKVTCVPPTVMKGVGKLLAQLG